MKTLFKSQDLWDLVENGFVNDAEDEQRTKENKKKDSKALSSLFSKQCMTPSSRESQQQRPRKKHGKFLRMNSKVP